MRRTIRANWPLAVRLTLAMTAVFALAVAILTALAIRREQDSSRTQLERQAHAVLNVLAVAVADPILKRDVSALDDYVAGVVEEATVLNARVYDGEGRILADAVDNTLVFQHLVDPFAQRVLASPVTLYEWQPDRLVAGQSITIGRQMLGAVSMEISSAPLEATVAALRNQGITVGVLAALAAALLAAVYSRVITGPLGQLVTATRRFASGDLKERVPPRVGDEFALVGASFNTMAGQLQETIGSLERQTHELEQRVQDLDFLNRISEAIHRTGRDLDSLLTLIKDQVTQLLKVDSFYVALYDADQALLSYPLAVKHHKRQSWPNRPLENRLTDQVIRTGQPRLISRNAPEELARSGMPVSEETPAAWLGVPMTAHDQTIGCMAVFSTAPETEFTAENLNLLSILAGYLTVAIENIRSFQALALSAEENRRLYDEARQAGEVQRRLANENQVLLERSQRAVEELNALARRLTAQAWQDYFVQQKAEMIVEDGERSAAVAASSQHVLNLPVVLRGTSLGSLTLERAPTQAAWDPNETGLIRNMLERIGLALDNARLLEETQQRIAELVTINTLSQALTAQLDVKALAELVGERIRQTFAVKQAYVALYDVYTNLIEIPYLAEGDERLTIPPVPLGQGLSSIIIKNRQPLFINDDAERRATELGAIVAGAMPKSFLGVPIFIGDDVAGVLSVQSAEQEGLFTDADVRLLSTIAASTGVALQNARLFAETQQRLTEMATINIIGQALTAQLDLNTLTEVVGDKILQAFNVSDGYIALYDKRTDLIEIPYFREGNVPVRIEPAPLGQGLASVIINSRQPLLINHDAEHSLSELGAIITGTRPAQSYLGVPILLGEEPIGVISVQSHEREGLFSESDARLLSTIANSVGVAVQNARLFAETQRRAQQLSTAAEVSRAANTVLDPDELIRQAAELIRERFDLYYAAVFLVDGSGQWAVLKHATGTAGQTLLARGHQLEVGGQSMVGTAVSLRLARIALDVGTEPVRFANPLLPDTRSELALPLALGNTVLGALDVQSIRPNAFAQTDIAVLQTMADQLAIALQNARLFAATQSELAERRRTQAELVKVRLGLERSTEAVFITDVDGIITYANPAFEQVYGWKPEEALGQTPRIIKSGVVPQERYKDFWSTLLNKQVVAGEIINKTKDGRLIPIEGANNPILDADGNLIGFLAMHRDISERKRAEAELQRRAQQLAASADIGRAATSTLDLDQLLRDSVELIRDRFGFYHASVFLIEPGSQMAVVRESTGEAGRQLKERRHSLAVRSKSLVGRATAGHVPMVVQDVTLDPTHFKNPLLPDTRAEAVVPMMAGGTVVGALDVQSTAANAFAESDISTLVTIADQLAVAVQNARLFERTRRQARREKLVVDITNKIRAAPDAEGMLRTAVSELRQALGVREGMVRLSPVTRAPSAPAGGNGHDRDPGEHNSGSGGNGSGQTPSQGNGSGEIL